MELKASANSQPILDSLGVILMKLMFLVDSAIPGNQVVVPPSLILAYRDYHLPALD